MLRLCLAFLVVTGALLGSAAAGYPAEAGAAQVGKPCRGIALLSSSIERTVPAAEILDFVETCGIRLAVVDFAWITHHWPMTNLPAVERLCVELRKRGVEVAVMYRPRTLRPSEADLHYAVGADGAIATSHNDLCFAHEDSRVWAAAWGKRVLAALPSVRNLILYNLRPSCQCVQCRTNGGRPHIAAWLEQCRREWTELRPGLKMGHVGVGAEYAEQFDTLYPFLPLIRDGDRPVDVAQHLQSLATAAGGKAALPLVKVCWEQATNNTTEDIVNAVRLCSQQGSGFVLWYYDWIFHDSNGRYDEQAIVTALGGEWSKLARYIVHHSQAPSRRAGAAPGSRQYTAHEMRSTDAETFFEKLVDVPEGYHRFSALWALQWKAVNTDTSTRDAITRRAIELVGDPKEPPLRRWQCCYVLAGSGDQRAIPVLGRALSEAVPVDLRAAAACALGAYDSPEARQVLEKAGTTEKNAEVRRSIARALQGEFRKTRSSGSFTAAGGTPPPALTFPYHEEKVERLPWPHAAPGAGRQAADHISRDVWVINDFPLYQADEVGRWRYFHGGLDIVLDNGTRIYAIKDGWVKSVAHSSVAIADAKDSAACYGWQYAHLGSIQVSTGEFVKQGKWIGSVEFDGLAHLHLSKVFSEGTHWGTWSYQCAPNAHFAYLDEEPPVIEKPFRFFPNNSDELVRPTASGTVSLRGAVDIVVGMRDGGRFARSKQNGFGDRLGVARIEYEIAPNGDARRAVRRKSFDFGKLKIKCGTWDRTFGTELTKVVYKHWGLLEPARKSGDKNLSYYIITNCPPGEPPKELDSRYRDCCWDTTEVGRDGRALFPDGPYTITVTAFDFAGNSSRQSMTVEVNNARKRHSSSGDGR